MKFAPIALACTLACTATLALSACGSGDDAPAATRDGQRVNFADVQRRATTPLPSPDTTSAVWTVAKNGQSIHFANPGKKPLLTLMCNLRERPTKIAVSRHVPAQPGQSALFPVIGNGTISRLPVDAALEANEWQWRGIYLSTDERLDVFTGSGAVEATLPGGGTLVIKGSRMPGEFIRWCRAGGK